MKMTISNQPASGTPKKRPVPNNSNPSLSTLIAALFVIEQEGDVNIIKTEKWYNLGL